MSPSQQKLGSKSTPKRLARGFVKTGGILQNRVRKASEKRGFVETRILTNWAELVGEATAAIARPVKVGYGRQGFGATLTLLTNGANAPMLQAELPKIRERVNSCYGHAAISRIRLTQTAEIGFSEDQAKFEPKPKENTPSVDPKKRTEMTESVAIIEDDNLRSALAALGQNILTQKTKPT